MVCIAFASATAASNLYKWQDKDGIWHFSSTPPESGESFNTVSTPANPKPMVRLQKLGLEREPEYAFTNNLWGPVELRVKLNDTDNVTSEPPFTLTH